jgi:CrcB protein
MEERRRMNPLAFAAVGVGAALGAWLRWWFSEAWNATVPALPLGTLVSNLVGGYLVGIAVAYFTANADIPAEWRLFAITGFLGGLTTFSTFSAEAVSMLGAGHFAAALAHSAAHLLGSFAMTALGILSYKAMAA